MNRAGFVPKAIAVLVSLYCQTAAAWSDGAGFRSMEVLPGTSGKAGFTLMDPKATGVWFTNELRGDAYLTNAVAHNGAGVAIGDVDGDGWQDIYLCSLQGPNRLYRNLGNWHFEEMDIGGAACADQLSTGATFADVDGDGDLDLFLGGRVKAGRYPEPANSCLLRNDGETFSVAQSFPDFGLVSGAVFTDLNGDGEPDLAVACEWGPVRLFRNEGGKLVAWDAPVTINGQPSTISQLTGWWNGIAAGDFDGDGRLDLVASNWGRNWRTDQPPGVDIPVQLFYGDFASNGVVQTVLASFDPKLSMVTPWRERKVIAAAIPSVAERLPNHHAYGRASVQDVLGNQGVELQATTPDSMVFLNRGDHFEARPLPIEAQFAPAFGIGVADFDGDGKEDVFLAQNFFGVDAETSRHDAGTGLLLLGDGRGGFRALGPREAGIAIYGEQRGCAVCDYDADGRMDLAVTQNGAETKLYRNREAKPGLRVRLHGPAGNPSGVGAELRLKFGQRFGPAREVHAGGGYWSQDSAIEVLSTPEPPDEIWIRWAGGRVTTSVIPHAAKEILVDFDGRLAVRDPR